MLQRTWQVERVPIHLNVSGLLVGTSMSGTIWPVSPVTGVEGFSKIHFSWLRGYGRSYISQETDWECNCQLNWKNVISHTDLMHMLEMSSIIEYIDITMDTVCIVIYWMGLGNLSAKYNWVRKYATLNRSTLVYTASFMLILLHFGVYSFFYVNPASLWCIQLVLCQSCFTLVYTACFMLILLPFGVYSLFYVNLASLWCIQLLLC